MARASSTRRIKISSLRDLSRKLWPVVAKNKAEAERLIVDIEKRQARISEDFYRVGLALKKRSHPAL